MKGIFVLEVQSNEGKTESTATFTVEDIGWEEVETYLLREWSGHDRGYKRGHKSKDK